MVSAALPPRPCRCKGRPFPGRRVSSRKSQAPQRRQQEGEPDPEQSPGPVWRGGRSLAGPRPCSHTNTQTHTEGETPRSLPAFEQIPSSLDSLWTGLTAVHNGWTADQRGHNHTLALSEGKNLSVIHRFKSKGLWVILKIFFVHDRDNYSKRRHRFLWLRLAPSLPHD